MTRRSRLSAPVFIREAYSMENKFVCRGAFKAYMERMRWELINRSRGDINESTRHIDNLIRSQNRGFMLLCILEVVIPIAVALLQAIIAK